MFTTDTIKVTEKVTQELLEAANQYLSQYVCAPGSTFDESFYDANELFCNATALLEEGEPDCYRPSADLIAAVKTKEDFQAALATGQVEIVAIYDLDHKRLAEKLPYPCEPVPLALDQIGNLANCAPFGSGDIYLINECVPSVIAWQFDTPIVLQNEDDLIAWLNRIYDDLGLHIFGFLKVRVPSGALVTVFGQKFNAWVL